MPFRIKVDGRVLMGIYPSAQAAFKSAADQHPEARSIGVFLFERWKMSKMRILDGLGFVPAFKGAQGGMLKERLDEAEAKRLAAEHGGSAHPPEFSTWWGWDAFVPVSAEEARA